MLCGRTAWHDLLDSVERVAAVGADDSKYGRHRRRQIPLVLVEYVVEITQPVGIQQMMEDDGVVERLRPEVRVQACP